MGSCHTQAPVLISVPCPTNATYNENNTTTSLKCIYDLASVIWLPDC